MPVIGERDFALLRLAREYELFEDVEPTRIDLANGFVLIACSDCDQRNDINTYYGKLCKEHRDDDRIHSIRLNGGGFLLAESRMVEDDHEDRVILKHADQGREMKDMTPIIALGHFDCGAAQAYGISFMEGVAMLVRGKQRLLERCPNANVAVMGHIDYGFGFDIRGKRTYQLATKRWPEWCNDLKFWETLCPNPGAVFKVAGM